MNSSEKLLVVYVDVDDTFVRSVGVKRIPIPLVIAHIKALYEQGAVLYCWSSGGKEYARSSAEEFGIERYFQAFMPKPNVMLDDQAVADWRTCIQVHPLSVDHRGTEEYWLSIQGR